MIFGEKMCNMIQVPQQVKLNNSSENNNSSGVVNNSVEPFSFSALHFLRAYNRLLSPTGRGFLYAFLTIVQSFHWRLVIK